MLFLAGFLAGIPVSDATDVETDPEVIAGFLDAFRSDRQLPGRYRIVRRSEGRDSGRATWRVDTFAGAAEHLYWRLEYDLASDAPPKRRELLLTTDPAGRWMVWEDDRAPRPLEGRRPVTADPFGRVTFAPASVANARLYLADQRAELEFIDARNRRQAYRLDRGTGMVLEHTTSDADGAHIERRWLETFDADPDLDPAFFAEIRERLDREDRLRAAAQARSTRMMTTGQVVGGLLPLFVAFLWYRRQLPEPTRGRLLIGAAAFLIGYPLLLVGLSAATFGFLSMVLTMVSWKILHGPLAAETARLLTPFMNALLLSSLLAGLVLAGLRLTVVRRARKDPSVPGGRLRG
jgi:hypothetical protein